MLKFVEVPRPLESAVIGVRPASGFLGGSIPDHVVGAPLKRDGHAGGYERGATIPDHVVGAAARPQSAITHRNA